jgi:uncharacterized membrane protein YbhN (UPF0104 family)
LRPASILRIAFLIACGAALVFFLARFPWRDVPAVLARGNLALLCAAVVVNLGSIMAKGTAWYFLLRSAAPCSLRAAQEANLLGAGMNTVSVAVMGETARIQDLALRERLPLGPVAASVVRTRAVEALALAFFMVLAPTVITLPPLLHSLQVTGGALVLALVAVAWSGKRVRVLEILPARVRAVLSSITETGSARTFIPALLFALLNWIALWATYHLVLSAFEVRAPLAASFTALILTNLGGLFRLSPGNVGVTQAATIVALLPFGIHAPEGLVVGLALQAVQTLPVLALALLLFGGRHLAARTARKAESGKE